MQRLYEQFIIGRYPDIQQLDGLIMTLISSGSFLRYLLRREDTITRGDRQQPRLTRQEGYSVRSGLKTAFWLAASVCAALLIGQLK